MKEERVLKEYPNSTRLLDGKKVTGIGNLILTTERLVFLHQVTLDDKQTESLQKLSATAPLSKLLDYTLTLHKKGYVFSSALAAPVPAYLLQK